MERSQLIEHFAMNIASLYRHTMKSRRGAGEGLSRPQLHALMLLKRETLTVKNLAKLMDTGSSAATQLVNHLAAAGFIERLPDPNDARITRVKLSSSGISRLNDIKRQNIKRLEQQFSSISNEDLMTLVRITAELIGTQNSENKEGTIHER